MLNKKCQPNRLVISIIIALVCLISGYFFLFRGLQNSEASTTVQQASVSERRMEIHEPSMPKNVIEITEIRNLQSSDFPSNFELDIKNVSDKPILYVRFAAVLTNSRSYTPSGRPIGFDLFYGNRRLSSEREKAQKGDELIPPGGTATLRTIESNSRAMVIKAQREPEFASKGRSQLLLVLQIINFGDGTSFLNDKHYKHQDVSLNHRLLMDSMQSTSIQKFAFSHTSVRNESFKLSGSLVIFRILLGMTGIMV